MPYSQLAIINQSLSLIGRKPVTNVNDDDSAFLMQTRLSLLVPDLLKQATWNFAIVYRLDDTPLTNNFSPDFTYTYQLPANFGRFDRFSYYITPFGFYYRFVDNLLLTNALPVQYYYVAIDADYSTFTPDFSLCLAYYLASQTCLALTNNKELTAYLQSQYAYFFDKAVLSNDMERQIGQTPYNDFDRQSYI